MDDIVTIATAGIGIWITGILFGWWVREQVAIRKVARMFEQLEVEEEETEKDNKVRGVLEIHHGHFYMFDKETGKFYGQGETAKELSTILREQHSDKTFVLSDEDCDILGIK